MTATDYMIFFFTLLGGFNVGFTVAMLVLPRTHNKRIKELKDNFETGHIDEWENDFNNAPEPE